MFILTTVTDMPDVLQLFMYICAFVFARLMNVLYDAWLLADWRV